VFGEKDGRAAQPATFLVNHPPVKAKDYKYVAGDGVEQAVEDGIIQIGYGRQQTRKAKPAPVLKDSPVAYVRTGNNKWVGFKSVALAEQYARQVGGLVQSRDEVLASKGTR
jgi:hypothetical protein